MTFDTIKTEMPTLVSTKDTTTQKLKLQENPQVLFTDFDGTLFSPNHNILSAPIYNRRIGLYLKTHTIPFILVTGRSDWGSVDKQQLALLGLPQPDSVITANGTVIYHLFTNNTYARDMEWEALMHYSKVKWADGKVESWNKLEITSVLRDYLLTQKGSFTFNTGNTFLIRIKCANIHIFHLEQIRKDILTLFPSGVRVIFTEKLLRKNTHTIFSGDILITPKAGGKDNAVRYLLEKYAKTVQKPLYAFLFGDATVDIPMLTLKENPKYYILSQYLVHPTPLAQRAAQAAQKVNSHLFILNQDGPKAMLAALTGSVSTQKADKDSFSDFQQPASPVKPEKLQTQLSPAQNNSFRQILKRFEPLLDKIVDKNLSPNEVSFLGLTKLSEGLEKLYKIHSSPLEKIQGLYNYGFGNLTDVLDGIRARNSDKKEENGQLVDGFSDRAKEFMQLFIRAKRRREMSETSALNTLLSGISCALPSIARAQAEILGKVVAERDEKGGSMIDRTKYLFYSLLMDTIGAHQKSESIDYQIYSANRATFQNRLSAISNISERSLARHPELIPPSLSGFQKKALERWLLYIDVLQQEDTIIKKYLVKYPKLLKEYEKQSLRIAKDYLSLKVNTLRKKWGIKDYKLQIKNYL